MPPDWREAIRKGQAQGCGPGRVAIRKGQANKQVSWTEVGHPGPADVPACGDTDHLVPVRPPGVRGWPSQSGSWAITPRVDCSIRLVGGAICLDRLGNLTFRLGQSGRDGQSNQPGGLLAMTVLGWAQLWLDGRITFVEPSGRPAQQWASHKVTMRRLRGDDARGLRGSRAGLGGWGQPARRWPMADGGDTTGRGLGRVWRLALAGVRAPSCRVDFPWGEGLYWPSFESFQVEGLSPEIEGGHRLVNQEAFLEGGSSAR